MSIRARNRLTAWLGLIAMWLIVLAPVVSQLRLEARADDAVQQAVLCSATQPAVDLMHAGHGDSLAACGYCDLLADHVALPGVPPLPPVLVMLLLAVVVPALSTRFVPLGAFPSGRPRAPPAFPRPGL